MVTMKHGRSSRLVGPPRWRLIWLGALAVVLVAGCSSSSNSSGGTATSAGAATPTATSPATSPAASTTTTPAAAGKVPTSCSAIPTSVITPLIGTITVTRQISATSHSVSCEFLASLTAVLILNIGAGGTPANFAVLERSSGSGGRTTAPVSGLGSAAFSISKGGVPGGMGAISSSGVIFAVTARNSFAQDEALIKQLMALY
jgi:hypothetical protein